MVEAAREPEELWPAEAQAAVAGGFGAIKFPIGGHPAERELPILAGIKGAHGASLEMRADGNGAYSVPQSVRVARGLGELGFTWLEEPVNRFRVTSAIPGTGRTSCARTRP